MARKYLCGTPTQHCMGSRIACNAALGKSFQQKAHQSRPEAFRCNRKYHIQELGYTATDIMREIRKPEGGILLMTKQSHFGQELRLGKNQDGKGVRYMPKAKGQSGALIT